MNLCEVSPADATSRAAPVLLVDNEEALLEMFAEILAPHFTVATARSAPEADAWLQRRACNVIVAHHSMPGEKGLGRLARLRHSRPNRQRVLGTGKTPPETH